MSAKQYSIVPASSGIEMWGKGGVVTQAEIICDRKVYGQRVGGIRVVVIVQAAPSMMMARIGASGCGIACGFRDQADSRTRYGR